MNHILNNYSYVIVSLDQLLTTNLLHPKQSTTKVIFYFDKTFVGPLQVVLMDLFTLPDGIRLRDHLSHGKVSPQCIDETLASILLVITVVLAHQPPDSADKLKDVKLERLCEKDCPCHTSEVFFTCWELIQAYHSQFHPLAISKRSALSCLQSCLNAFPLNYHDVPTQMPIFCEKFRSMTSHCLKKSIAVDDVSEAIKIYSATRIQTLYRY